MDERLRAAVDDHFALAGPVNQLLPGVAELGDVLCRTFAGGGKLLVFGNGGSAADAQHFAAELVGHFHHQRRPLPAIALTTDSSVVTAVANDYAWADVFARQVRAHALPGDVVVGITTSGTSENVVRGLVAARELGATAVALTGSGGTAAGVADRVLAVPATETARVQEMHILLIHLLSDIVDEWAAGQPGATGPAGQR